MAGGEAWQVGSTPNAACLLLFCLPAPHAGRGAPSLPRPAGTAFLRSGATPVTCRGRS